ncbi:hypothetical protein [Sphingomonas crusticola]|uniref:hypothetical protein n=1 Tax=Sphingomonas crusticola TaxID=1697973 RepID=UPI000E285BA7|nr:hypothetical protein [Sphingomonas crusticola]
MTQHILKIPFGLAAALLAAGAATAQPGSVAPPAGTPSGQLIGTPLSMEANDRATADAQARAEAAQNGRDNARTTRGGKSKSHPAKLEEIVANATIFDNKGVEIGYVKAVDAEGVVVATANGQVRVPVNSFGVSSKGLVLDTTKANFDALMAKATGG